jgi:hypothetical protein
MKDTTIDMLDILKKEGYSIQDINKFLLTKPIKELRDQFAMAALTGLISSKGSTTACVGLAFQFADAMLIQRVNKTNE